MTGEWNGGNFITKSSINQVIKSRNMRWAWHVAGKDDRTYWVLVGEGRRKERDYLEDVGVNGTVILKWVLKR